MSSTPAASRFLATGPPGLTRCPRDHALCPFPHYRSMPYSFSAWRRGTDRSQAAFVTGSYVAKECAKPSVLNTSRDGRICTILVYGIYLPRARREDGSLAGRIAHGLARQKPPRFVAGPMSSSNSSAAHAGRRTSSAARGTRRVQTGIRALNDIIRAHENTPNILFSLEREYYYCRVNRIGRGVSGLQGRAGRPSRWGWVRGLYDYAQ